MQRSSINTSVLILLIITATSCCDSELIREIHFSPEMLLINPYIGDEVSYFKNLTGDSLIIRGEYREREFYNFYPEKESQEGKSCKGKYVNLEDNVTRLTSTDLRWRFDITLSFYYYLPQDSSAPYISFNAFNFPDSIERTESARGAFFDMDTIFNRGMYLTHQYDYHHQIEIGPNTYTDVYEIFLMKQLYSPSDWVENLYYSISLGIVGFKTRQGETWYLDTSKKRK